MQLIQGDCLEKMKEIESNSVDAVVTDPPYGLSFMGKKWDYDVPSQEIWEECLRVLKPGGHLLAFSGTRTYHRMVVAIEDSGFEVRDMIEWVYGSGFPKSRNIGKDVEKINVGGLKNLKQIGTKQGIKCETGTKGYSYSKEYVAGKCMGGKQISGDIPVYEINNEWEGWGTALKPAHEPICMARKPLAEKTVAENVLKYGTGGINIDESRVDYNGEIPNIGGRANHTRGDGYGFKELGENIEANIQGRFPANLIHDNSEEVRECFPETKSGKMGKQHTRHTDGSPNGIYGKFDINHELGETYGDSGNASRFFKSIIYQAKASKSERNKGLDSYLTVKYNGSILDNNKTLCKEENMVAVQLLEKVMSDSALMSFNIDESGANIMGQCHKDSLSTILTETNRIIGLKIYNSLMLSLTNESTQGANSEKENGGNLAESVADLKRWILTITNGNLELALGASRVVLKMLSLISEEENWKKSTNFHSTVKPIALMEYLVKLVSREGAVVLDPFMGSGSTGIACKNRNFIGIELDPEYFEIANKRINQ